MSEPPLLTVRGISKRFGAVQALSAVDLEIREGEAVGLVGANGAGKSTLVKAISGVVVPDGGVIEWRGRPVDLRRPSDAQRLGIATVHQDLSLCDNLDTVGNLFLGRELRRFGRLREVEMEERSRELLDALAVRIPSLRVPVASLSAAQRQGVAIARALIGRPRLVVLDEPTAALGPAQAALVLDMVRRLRDQRLGVLLVSHEMEEVRSVADRVAVLRVGHNSGFFDTKYTTREQIDSAVTGDTTAAVTLQRSLLPHGLPEQNALDVAYRYLPAQAAVGGDWFDVIPLAGARVALVVGDIVGHGMHAAATMGRLRTAVHNFSMLDLPPDDLLAHLDELVARIDKEEGGELPTAGATCLYAIYDPVSRECELARAGHLPPALVHPDGTVEFLDDVPPGPPLGVGGLPFEAVRRTLPEGSRLVLYTDGLVEDRSRDIDVGLDLLSQALAGPDRARGGGPGLDVAGTDTATGADPATGAGAGTGSRIGRIPEQQGPGRARGVVPDRLPSREPERAPGGSPDRSPGQTSPGRGGPDAATVKPADRDPEETCDAVLAALLPDQQRDDIALLVARTRALPEDRVAHWDLPPDPAAVASVREAATARLSDWGLDELGFTTELVLSELVTNSIRYATGAIQVRLLLDRTLICEVADTSSTSPHLRYAATTDEGGRGLFLVAQLSARWGTRYTPTGKIIWVEQELPPGFPKDVEAAAEG